MCNFPPHCGEERAKEAVNVIKMLEKKIDQQDKIITQCKDALQSISEYWNRDNNEKAMQDACWHNVETAEEVLQFIKECED